MVAWETPRLIGDGSHTKNSSSSPCRGGGRGYGRSQACANYCRSGVSEGWVGGGDGDEVEVIACMVAEEVQHWGGLMELVESAADDKARDEAAQPLGN
jgi:hypothetical protein